MDASDLHETDILELNVGGKLLSTTRETLTQATGSMLAAWFGPVWADHHKRDQQGRIFLNCDPYCFGRILSFLRCKLIEDPDHPAMPPAVQPESQAEFAALVRYFGLQDFMPDCAAGSSAEYFFDEVLWMERAEDWSAVTATNQHGYALAHPSLADGEHLIKCHIEKVGPNPWMFLGVTRQTYAQETLEHQATSFGWTPLGQHAAKEYTPSARTMHLTGSNRQPYWGEGYTLVFKIVVDGEQGFLSMGCVHSGHVFELQMRFRETGYRPLVFAVGAAPGTSVRIAAASWQDWSQFAQLPVV
ncbi:protein homooligomerization [Trebouxia sp. C0010 RCD-2024]